MALLDDTPPVDAPLADLGRAAGFAERFEAARSWQPGMVEADGPYDALRTPWPGPRGDPFWYLYFDKRRPLMMDGRHAWQSLTPLRVSLDLDIRAPWLVQPATVRAFVYPFGTALVLHLRLGATTSSEWMTEELIDHVNGEVRNGDVRAEWGSANAGFWHQPAGPQATMRGFGLAAVVAQIRAMLHRAVWGARPDIGARITPAHADPFTILTILRAATDEPRDKSIADGGETHRLLHALGSGQRDWRAAALQPLATTTLKGRDSAAASHTVYALRRSRVVWMPSLFSDASGREAEIGHRMLAAYHRNLGWLSLQTEALCSFAHRLYPRCIDREPLPNSMYLSGRSAVRILGPLYGGAMSTYRSRSAKHQIDDPVWRETIDHVRAHFDMDGLK